MIKEGGSNLLLHIKKVICTLIIAVLLFQVIVFSRSSPLNITAVYAKETTYSYSGLISGGDVYKISGSNLLKNSNGLLNYNDFSVFDTSKWTWNYNSSKVTVSVEDELLKCVFSSNAHVDITYTEPLLINDGIFMGLETGGHHLESGTEIIPYFTNFTVSPDTNIFADFEWYRFLLTQHSYYIQRKTSGFNHETVYSDSIGSSYDEGFSCLITNKTDEFCEWYSSGSKNQYVERYGLTSEQLYFTLQLAAEAGKTMYLDYLSLTKGYYVTVQVPVGYQAVLYDSSSGSLSYLMSVSDVDNNGEIVFDIHEQQGLVNGHIEVLPTRPIFDLISELWMDKDIAFMFRMDDVHNNSLSDAFISYMMESQPAIKATIGMTTFFEDADSWEQARIMINDYGWEVASHTRTHYNAPRTREEIIGSFSDIEGNTSQICLGYIFSSGTYDDNDLTLMQEYGVPIGGRIIGHTEIPSNATAWLTFGSRDVEITDVIRGTTNYDNAKNIGRKSFVLMAHPQNWGNFSSMSNSLDTDLNAISDYSINWFATISEFYSYVELRRNCTTISPNTNGTYTITTDFTNFVKPEESTSVYENRILNVPLTYIFRAPEGFDASEWVILKNNEPILPQNYDEYPHMGIYDRWWEGYYCEPTTGTIYANVIGDGSDLISFCKLDVLSQPVICESSVSFKGETFGAEITSYDWSDNVLLVSVDGVSGYTGILDIYWQKKMDNNVIINFANGTTTSAQDYYNFETKLISIPYVSGNETILISSASEEYVLTVSCTFDGNPVETDVYVNDLRKTTDTQGETQFNLQYKTYEVKVQYQNFEKTVIVLMNEDKKIEIAFTNPDEIPEFQSWTILLAFLIISLTLTYFKSGVTKKHLFK